jgi:hypothetical protein
MAAELLKLEIIFKVMSATEKGSTDKGYLNNPETLCLLPSLSSECKK